MTEDEKRWINIGRIQESREKRCEDHVWHLIYVHIGNWGEPNLYQYRCCKCGKEIFEDPEGI